MKKLLFIFFTLITFANVSYASFPVGEVMKTNTDSIFTPVLNANSHYSKDLEESLIWNPVKKWGKVILYLIGLFLVAITLILLVLIMGGESPDFRLGGQ